MNHLPVTDADLDPRRAAILGAAFGCFCQYGFRRTAMEDIARAAGLSRAALYLHFANKQDIYRSLLHNYYAQTDARIRAALQPAMAPEAALSAVFAAKAGPELEAMFDSPHGEELLDANFRAGADIVQEGEAQIAAILANWLQREADAGRIALPDEPEELAQTMIAALSGIKSPGAGIDAFRAGAARLATLMGRGLRAEAARA